MALRLKRNPGTSLLFHAHEQTVRLLVTEVQGDQASFMTWNENGPKHVRRRQGEVLDLNLHGETVCITVTEVSRNTVSLRIVAPGIVHVVREELAEVP